MNRNDNAQKILKFNNSSNTFFRLGKVMWYC